MSAEADVPASPADWVIFHGIEEYADLAASYWRSIAEAAARRERLTVEYHCKQVAATTRAAFDTVRMLGKPAGENGGSK